MHIGLSTTAGQISGRWSFSSAYLPLIALAWRWTSWGYIVVFVGIYILWWLHLNVIPATEVALVGATGLILVAIIATQWDLVGVLVSVLRWLLVVIVWLVSWWCAAWQGSHETSTVVGFSSGLSSSSLGDAAEYR